MSGGLSGGGFTGAIEGNTCFLSTTSGALSISAADVTLTGGGGANAWARVFSTGGNLLLPAVQNLTLTGGSGANTDAQIFATTGSVSSTLSGNLTLTGGLSTNCQAQVQALVLPNTATVGGNCSLIGGSDTGSFARFWSKSAAQTLTITGNLTMTGGSGASTFALLGSESALTTTTIGGNCTITGGSAASSHAGVSTVVITIPAGNFIFPNIGGNLSMTAGTVSPALIGRLAPEAANALAGDITFTAIGGGCHLKRYSCNTIKSTCGSSDRSYKCCSVQLDPSREYFHDYCRIDYAHWRHRWSTIQCSDWSWWASSNDWGDYLHTK